MVELNKIWNEDCRETMKRMEDNSIDSIVTDPPYELGFMGKKWDSSGIAYNVQLWKECLRVLKPGGYLLSLGSTRTSHRMVCAIEDAGFEIRDTIQWIYGQGFPKSLNLGDGYGTALKPAHEPICLARKPLSEKTIASNVLKWGTGGINVDGCRIESNRCDTRHGGGKHSDNISQLNPDAKGYKLPSGRFPANIIHDGSDEVVSEFPNSKSGSMNCISQGKNYGIYGKYKGHPVSAIASEGSAARFFYCAKASKAERGEGNNHPTVKPIALMRYLCRLITPPGGIVLDPFSGSGTTRIAAYLEGFNFIGSEIDKDSCEIADKRIFAYKMQQTINFKLNN